jgi:hypothetical protein
MRRHPLLNDPLGVGIDKSRSCRGWWWRSLYGTCLLPRPTMNQCPYTCFANILLDSKPECIRSHTPYRIPGGDNQGPTVVCDTDNSICGLGDRRLHARSLQILSQRHCLEGEGEGHNDTSCCHTSGHRRESPPLSRANVPRRGRHQLGEFQYTMRDRRLPRAMDREQ